MNEDLISKIGIREEVPVKSFSIAAFICRKENETGKYLILKRTSKYLKNSWQMVSGKLEKGETAWLAALREIKEETGIIPDRLYSSNRVECFYEANQNCINLVPIFIAFVENQTKVTLSDSEHSEYKWITIEEAEQYLVFPNHIEVLKYIEENFIKKKPNEFLQIKFKE